MRSNSLYFDYNATTPLNTEVKQAIQQSLEWFANPSASYKEGKLIKQSIDNTRSQVRSMLEASEGEVIFTSGATEANNLILKGYLEKFKHSNAHFIISAIEHPSVIYTAQYIAENWGIDLSIIPVDQEGFINVMDVIDAIRPETVLISAMTANNETGAIQPITEIAKIATSNNIFFHTDAVQAIGKMALRTDQLGVDAVSLSAHKFGGPKGIGALWIKDPKSINPTLHGGGQENGMRGGTENTLGIIGLGKACEVVQQNFIENHERLRRNKLILIHHLIKNIPGLEFNSGDDLQRYTPNTVNIRIDGLRAEALLALTNEKYGVSISLGSACSASKMAHLSHVLKAMNLTDQQIRSSMRISFGPETTESEIISLTLALKEGAKLFQQIAI